MPFILKRPEVMKSFVYRLFPVYKILDFINYIILFLEVLIFFSFLNLGIISFFLFIFFEQMFYTGIIGINPLSVFFNFTSTLEKFIFSLFSFTLQFLIEENFYTFYIIPDFNCRSVFDNKT